MNRAFVYYRYLKHRQKSSYFNIIIVYKYEPQYNMWETNRQNYDIANFFFRKVLKRIVFIFDYFKMPLTILEHFVQMNIYRVPQRQKSVILESGVVKFSTYSTTWSESASSFFLSQSLAVKTFTLNIGKSRVEPGT